MADKTGVALGGFMGAGKSTVGRALAARLSWPFVDLDDVLRERHGPIALQFADVGESGFRAREAAALLEHCGRGTLVLATGGGTWVDPSNRARLQAHFHTVVLDAPLAALEARASGTGRPLWDATVAQRYASRRTAYADADRVLDARRPVEDLVEEIAQWLA